MKKLFIFILAAVLALQIFSLQPVQSSGNIKKVTFTQYLSTRKPLPTGCTPTVNDQINDYVDLKFSMPSSGMNYKINYSTRTPGLSDKQIDTAIKNAAATWSNADPKQIFQYGGKTTANKIAMDGTNAIFWMPMGTEIIAQASMMIDGSTHQLLEVDMAFNKNLRWSVSDPALGDCGGKTHSFDLQNTATHEFGHWIGLGDLYNTIDQDLTMYGYGARAELKKNSLGLGDISGVLTVAP